MGPESTRERFDRIVVVLLDDAYTLARYLTRDEHSAQDVVQEAYLRAWRHFATFRGDDARHWLLTIVRNCAYTWRRGQRASLRSIEYVDDEHTDVGNAHSSADAQLLEEAGRTEVHLALEQLSPEFREVIVLREMEGMSYKEIGRVTGTPIGTVMSRLARARRQLRDALRIGGESA